MEIKRAPELLLLQLPATRRLLEAETGLEISDEGFRRRVVSRRQQGHGVAALQPCEIGDDEFRRGPGFQREEAARLSDLRGGLVDGHGHFGIAHHTVREDEAGPRVSGGDMAEQIQLPSALLGYSGVL